jgi:hypothetical protein
MKVTAIVLCAVSLFAFSLSPYEKMNKKAAKSVHSDRVFLDVDRIRDDKLWLRVNNQSDEAIWISSLATSDNCEDYPEYYFDRVVQQRYSEENRKAMEASNPSLIGKTDEEIASQRLLSPRTVTIREEREMNWSDAFGGACGTLEPKQKASFQVPLSMARQYHRLYVLYYIDGDPAPGRQVPERRLYFDLTSLKQQAPTN